MESNSEPRGLSSDDATLRLKRDGYNEIQSAKPTSIWRLFFSFFKEPMLLLLLSCGLLYLVLGDLGEGLMLIGSMTIVIAISIFQQKKTQSALEKLKDLSSPRALVIRGGNKIRIPGREVVTDDIIVLQEGDRVPADAELLSVVNLQTDESLLTGESAAISKSVASDQKTSDDNRAGKVYSATLIVRGHGLARVTATGARTELGKIGKLLRNIEEGPTLLQIETRRIIRTFFIIGIIVCVALVVVYGLTRNNWMDGILYGLSLAMAMIPEEFAVVLTLFLVLGSLRLSRKNVLTRNASAIETLGSMTVLCTDKTGTLTENRMALRKLWISRDESAQALSGEQLLKPEHSELLRISVLASQPSPFDPMEKAIHSSAENLKVKVEHSAMIREYPLTSGLLAMSRVYESQDGLLVAAKGAPEAIARLCRMNEEQMKNLHVQINGLASQGYRMLGVASANCKRESLPESQSGFEFQFCGLLAMEDPLRKSVPDDVKSCYSAGIRVIMVTGDYPVTAQHIARQMGLKNPDEVLTGAEISAMNDEQLQSRLQTANIFARVVPEQKLRLVKALQANGHIIGMTGDGVNDAPALRAAHIGIAMGQRGTDVAREAADLVLLDDNFGSVISAVRIGRRIFDNIRKAMIYVFAVHIPIAGMTLLPVLFSVFPVILFPLHIAFLELIIDPASTLIFEAEAEEKDIMNRPPASISKSSFGLYKIIVGLLLGLSVFGIAFAVLFISNRMNIPPDQVRTLTFTTLIFANLGLIFSTRSFSKSLIELIRDRNRAIKWIVGGAILFLGIVLFIPALRSLFHFAALNLKSLLICFGAAFVGMAWIEILKFFNKRKQINL